jgi:hypothetical protein
MCIDMGVELNVLRFKHELKRVVDAWEPDLGTPSHMVQGLQADIQPVTFCLSGY